MDPADTDIAAAVTAALGSPADRAHLFEWAARAKAARDQSLDAVLDDLASRAAAGHEVALELLLEIVHRLGLARPPITAIILDASLVDDVAQETLVTVERHIGSYEGRSHFRTWLYTVARNQALMVLRRRSDPVDRSPVQGGRFSSVVAGRLTIEAVIDALPDPYRETMRLQLFDNLDYEAIGHRLGVPIGTVRSRLAKARDLLRTALTVPEG